MTGQSVWYYHGQPLSGYPAASSVSRVLWVKQDANGDGTRTWRYVPSSSVRLTDGDTAKACIRHSKPTSHGLTTRTWVNWYVMAYPVTYRNRRGYGQGTISALPASMKQRNRQDRLFADVPDPNPYVQLAVLHSESGAWLARALTKKEGDESLKAGITSTSGGCCCCLA